MTVRSTMSRILGGAAMLAVVTSIGSAPPAGAEEVPPNASTTAETTAASCAISVYADKTDRPPYKVWGTGYADGCERGAMTIAIYKANGEGFPEYLIDERLDDCTDAHCSVSTPTLDYEGGNYCVRVEYTREGIHWDCLM